MIAVKEVPVFHLSRPAAALLGAVAMVVLGGFGLDRAYAAVDPNVLVFLFGVMILCAYLEVGGFFTWTAAQLVARARTPHLLLAAVVIASGVLSAFFINDTICLLFTPVVVTALARARRPPLPYLLALALASNVGSAMALTGNPQNMLVGVASGISYGRFIAALCLASVGGLAIVYGTVASIFRKSLNGADIIDERAGTDSADAPDEADEPPFDRRLVTIALLVFAGMLGCWLLGMGLPAVAVTGAAVMILVARRDPTPAFARVEWPLLVFFAALFVVTEGVRDQPIIITLAASAHGLVTGAPLRDASVVSGAILVLSNLVSNVPAVMLWLPVVPTLPSPHFIWLVMAMSSTFAGNLTLVGSMANLIVAERASARGVVIGFGAYLRVGVPVTLLTLAWGIATLAVLSRWIG